VKFRGCHVINSGAFWVRETSTRVSKITPGYWHAALTARERGTDSDTYKTQTPVIAASPYRAPKSVGVKGDFGHFRSSEQHFDGRIRLATWQGLANSYQCFVVPVGIIQWRRETPDSPVQGAAFGGANIRNSEVWPLLANWRLHCRTDSAGICIA